MKNWSFLAIGLALVVVSPLAGARPRTGVGPAPATPLRDDLHAWTLGNDPVRLDAWARQRFAAATADLDRLRRARGARTVANTLQPYDDAANELNVVSDQAQLLYSVADAAALRDKGQALTQQAAAALTALSLDAGVYKALAAIPPPRDAATRHYLAHTLLEFRLGGVDRDDATRARVKTLQDRIAALSLVYNRNIHDDVRKVTATRAELDGLPADYITRHAPDAQGLYTITSDPPDTNPVRTYARNADLRRRLYVAGYQVAWPTNQQVLLDLLQARQDLATALGYPTYADLATSDQLMGSTANLKTFLAELDAASREPARREYQAQLAFAQQQQPSLQQISAADSAYWSEQYRRARYDFDAQSVRPYFPYDRVEAGIVGVAGRLFHVRLEKLQGVETWDPSVTVYDVVDGAERIGRVYLDMHPREGKDKWFSSSRVLPGIRGRQLPEGMLTCNFSGGVPNDPGLMQYDEVVTFFHEFGHLMHHILGSQGRWSGAGGFNVEGDFVEAPSQMLEEFFRDPATLQSFARHYQTNEVIPDELVQRMLAASAYGRGRWVQSQLYLSTLSLDYHTIPPAQLDLDAVLRRDFERFNPTAFVDGSHLWANFTHLTGYASNYYTYALDKVIALDFFNQFDRRNLLDGPTAMRYRRTVLAPGATKPAGELVHDFLGRPQNSQALQAWIGEEFTPTP